MPACSRLARMAWTQVFYACTVGVQSVLVSRRPRTCRDVFRVRQMLTPRLGLSGAESDRRSCAEQEGLK